MTAECPSDECLMCNGQACNKCGAGCWNNNPARKCEHDAMDRHGSMEPDSQFDGVEFEDIERCRACFWPIPQCECLKDG